MNLAWKEISYNKKKYLLIELILVLMIFMVMFLSGLANGLARAVSAGIENEDAANYILSTDAENLISVSSLEPDMLNQVKNSAKGEVTTLNIQRTNLNKKGNTSKLDVTYFAINPDEFLNPEVTAGKRLSSTANTIVLDNSFEDEGIKVGDVVEDSSTGMELTVAGFTKDEMYAHTPIGFISTSTYTDIRKNLNPRYELTYNAIVLQEGDTSGMALNGADIVDKASVVENIPGYKAEQMTIKMILWVLVFVSAAVLGVFFYIITLQKREEFGVMKAIGIRMGEIAGMQLAQVFLLAAFGMVLGNALAFGMSSMLPKSMPFYLKLADAAVISAAFVLIAIACSLFSTGKVAKVDPITTIGGN